MKLRTEGGVQLQAGRSGSSGMGGGGSPSRGSGSNPGGGLAEEAGEALQYKDFRSYSYCTT